jgi:4-amino-4-deoxy-L-arabinose transferase-like glycosyltransferase
VLVLLTLLLGAMAATVQPYDPLAPGCKDRTPPDETAHVLYVEHLLTERTLPVLESGSGNYEAHQPPLYYLTVAPAMALGQALGRGAPKDHFGAPPLDVWLGRLWSVLIAAGVTVACYLLGAAVFPRSRWLPLAAGLVPALLPGHLINLAAITNDGLAELLCTLAIWQCLLLVRQTPTRGRLIAIGLLTGGALLTKSSCLFLLPVAGFAVVLTASPWACPPSSWRRCLAGLGLVVGPALLVWAPWLAHNLAHYPGDPLVTKTFVEIFGQDRWTPERFYEKGLSPAGYWQLVLMWTYLSFWGVFGGAMVFMPGWYYLAAVGLTVAWLPGALLGLGRLRGADRATRSIWSLLALAGILVVVQFLGFNREFFQAQARYLLPAIGPIACALTAGWKQLGQRVGGERGGRWGTVAAWLVLTGLMLAALVEVAARGPVGMPKWL